MIDRGAEREVRLELLAHEADGERERVHPVVVVVEVVERVEIDQLERERDGAEVDAAAEVGAQEFVGDVIVVDAEDPSAPRRRPDRAG